MNLFDKINFKEYLSENLINVGNNVKRLRKENSMTQQDLAYLSDLETSLIGKIERYQRNDITLKTLTKISLVLKVKVEDLFINKNPATDQ